MAIEFTSPLEDVESLRKTFYAIKALLDSLEGDTRDEMKAVMLQSFDLGWRLMGQYAMITLGAEKSPERREYLLSIMRLKDHFRKQCGANAPIADIEID